MAEFEENFNVASDIALESKTPTVGTAWTIIRDGHDILAVDDFATNSVAGAVTKSDDLGTEDYDVECDIKITGASQRTGVGGRLTDINNSVHLRIKPSSNEFEMEKVVSGTPGALAASTDDTINQDTYYTLKFSCEGLGASQNFDGYFAGTLRLNPAAPNDAVLDTGEAFLGHNDTNPSGGTGNEFDNYSVTAKAAAVDDMSHYQSEPPSIGRQTVILPYN